MRQSPDRMPAREPPLVGQPRDTQLIDDLIGTRSHRTVLPVIIPGLPVVLESGLIHFAMRAVAMNKQGGPNAHTVFMPVKPAPSFRELGESGAEECWAIVIPQDVVDLSVRKKGRQRAQPRESG